MKLSRRQTLSLLSATSALGLLGGFAVSPVKADGLSDLMEPGPLGEHILGDPEAPVTIIEYASMTCPHCKRFHEGPFKEIKKKYIDTGKAKLYFREFPFDPRAAAAFMLAACAPKERYFSMIDVLFKQQSVWARSDKVVAELQKISKLAGFTQESFEACLKNQELLDNVVAIQEKAQKEYKVDATPSFFINGERYKGAPTVEEMGKAIEALL